MLAEAGITEMEIMEYADGVLAPARRPVVRAALATYPELMQLLESFLFTRGPLKDVYDEVLNAPVPDPPLRLLRPPVPPPPPPRRRGLDIVRGIFGTPASGYRRTALAFAAISAAVFAAWLLSRPVGHDLATFGERGFVASPALQRVLDETPMRVSVRIADGLSIVPQLTFSTRRKTWCRELTLSFGDDKQAGALACRGDDGDWRVQTLTPPSRKINPIPPPPDKSTIAGDEADEFKKLLDAARDSIMEGDALSADEEKRVIEDKWRPRP